MSKSDANAVPIVVFDNDDGWKEVLQAAGSHLDQRGIDRLKPALDGMVKTVIVEKHYIDKDYRDTFSHYHSKRFQTPDSRCIRLHFFAVVVKQEDLSNREKLGDSYLGYSVIRPTRPNCVGRTMLVPPHRFESGAHIRLCREKVNIWGIDLFVEGFPFISQDADVTVCAQSALWMTLRYFSNRYQRYGEIHPYQIGSLTSDYSIGRMFPSSGLFIWQISEALRQRRFEPLIYSKGQYGEQEFEHLLYTYIESGIPCLVATQNHIFASFGHYSDIQSSFVDKSKKFTYSSEFNRGFIINDDNCFPYQSLNKEGPRSDSLRADSCFRFSGIESFIAPLPDKVYLTAEAFQKVAEKFLNTFIPAHSPALNGKPLVLRLLLTTGSSFKRRLSDRAMGHEKVANLYRFLPMPHFVWVCDISTPEEYENGLIHGELIWDATRNGHELSGLVALHLPETVIYDRGAAYNQPKNLVRMDLPESELYALYTSNLQHINQDSP